MALEGVAARPYVSKCVWAHAHDTFLKGGDWRGAPSSSRALGRSDGRDWLFQVRTGPGVARTLTKAAARDWATKWLHLKHGLNRNLPQAAVSKGLWVNPLGVKNLTEFFFPFWLLNLSERDIFLQGIGGRWGGGKDGGWRTIYLAIDCAISELQLRFRQLWIFVVNCRAPLHPEAAHSSSRHAVKGQGVSGATWSPPGPHCKGRCCLWHLPRLSVGKLLVFWLFLGLLGCWLAAH